jgi:glycosyltransferase involved in cell wall biosynthesis
MVVEKFPQVSIILPTYNRAKLLRGAINSVLAQGYPCWELIVWDDGSTDDSGSLVRSLGDPRIKYFWGENKGAAAARNQAFAVASGEYVAFLDSDDIWVENKLEEQMRVLVEHQEIEALFGDFLNIDVETGEQRRTFEEYSDTLALLLVERIGDQLFLIRDGLPQVLAIENFIATDTVIARRSVIEKAGRFCENLRNSEDFELWWRMGLTETVFAYLNKVLLVRYKSSENLSGTSIDSCENTIQALDLCLQAAISRGRPDLKTSLEHPYRNAWQNLILLYAQVGKKGESLKAFWRSLRYGFRWGAIRLLFQAFFSIQG